MDVERIVVVKGRSFLVGLNATTVRKNSRTDHQEIEALSSDRHSKIVVVRVKVLGVLNDPVARKRVSIADRSPHNSDKTVVASARLNVLAAEVINGIRATVHAAEVPDTLSSSFCPS